nr:mating factor a1.3 [Moesziomyces parantarcticus]
MDAITLFAPVTVDAVATEEAPRNMEAPGQRGLPWTSGCIVA